MIRLLPIVLALSAPVIPAAGQTRPPAFLAEDTDRTKLETLHLQARVEGAVRVGPDGRGTVTLSIVPKAKMHVYAADAQGYVPFTVRIEPATALSAGRVTYPQAEISVFPPTGESSRVYSKPFTVTGGFVLTAAARRTLAATGTVAGAAHLRYQACDDRVCYRPASGVVSFDVVK